MNTIQDVLGQEVSVGDVVACIDVGSGSIAASKREVVEITKTGVKVKGSRWYPEDGKTSPKKATRIIKVAP